LAALNDVGLGYMRLGQPADDAVREERLSASSWRPSSPRWPPGTTLYILDEPDDPGSHFRRYPAACSRWLMRLVDAGKLDWW